MYQNCPSCDSEDIWIEEERETAAGKEYISRCESCGEVFVDEVTPWEIDREHMIYYAHACGYHD